MRELPKYRIEKEKGVYVVRKFLGFDHSWAEYSKPLFTSKKEQEAKDWVRERR